MLGRRARRQDELLIAGSRRALVPDDHVLVCVDLVLALGLLRSAVAECYAAGSGRPGIDPEAAVRLMLAGLLLGIVHDRRLMCEAQVNIAICRFAGYGRAETLPDHSGLTRLRQRWGAEQFRRIFARTVRARVPAGVATGEVVHSDSSLVQADVSRESIAGRCASAARSAFAMADTGAADCLLQRWIEGGARPSVWCGLARASAWQPWGSCSRASALPPSRAMCGRFAKYLSPDERAALRGREFRQTPRTMPGLFRPRYNVAPSQEVGVIRRHPETGELHEDPLVWGFVPRWTRDLKTARRPINARAETACTSPMFRDAFERRRCIVPMDAFYEWAGEKPPRQPWAVARRDGGEMLVAALWDGWRAPDGAILRSFAVITTDANETLLPIHHRMPVIIEPADVATWLGDDANAAAALMRPAPGDVLRAWPVYRPSGVAFGPRAVNDVRRDDPALLEPVV